MYVFLKLQLQANEQYGRLFVKLIIKNGVHLQFKILRVDAHIFAYN